jgi:hypothetical protein
MLPILSTCLLLIAVSKERKRELRVKIRFSRAKIVEKSGAKKWIDLCRVVARHDTLVREPVAP